VRGVLVVSLLQGGLLWFSTSTLLTGDIILILMPTAGLGALATGFEH
jgi:hypothetical protein